MENCKDLISDEQAEAIADKLFESHSQRKKDKDDGSNVSLSGDTNQLQGKNDKGEHMLVSEDNHVDNSFRTGDAKE